MATLFDDSSFLNGTNAPYIVELYERYLANPNSVDESWKNCFAMLAEETISVQGEVRSASWAPRPSRIIGQSAAKTAAAATTGNTEAASQEDIRRATLDSLRAIMLIRAYRIRGRLKANLDPLQLAAPEPAPEPTGQGSRTSRGWHANRTGRGAVFLRTSKP